MASVDLRHGDMLEVLPTLEAESFDACVTDAPYHLTSIVKRFGKAGAAPPKSTGATGVYGRAAAGFMGKQWDGGDVAFRPETWAAVGRVLKPGANLAVFGGTRTFHRLACAVEDAGFEIRDRHRYDCAAETKYAPFLDSLNAEQLGALAELLQEMNGGGELAWSFGSGFPKSKNTGPHCRIADRVTFADTWGTGLKPAYEPILLARKPLRESSAQASLLTRGTGCLNIDGCRVEAESARPMRRRAARSELELGAAIYGDGFRGSSAVAPTDAGRWPANLLHDGSAEVLTAFPEAPGQMAEISTSAPSSKTSAVYGRMRRDGERTRAARYDTAGATDFAAQPGARRAGGGSAARFFYSAKASRAERLGSKHPTVKPVELMAWLVRLVTPPGGRVLDPFAGSGTTGLACLREGFDALLIEREAEYVADIKRRLAHPAGGDTPLFGGRAP